MWGTLLKMLISLLPDLLSKKTEEKPKEEMVKHEPVVLTIPKPEMTWHPSPNFSVKPNREISAIILHHTGSDRDNVDLEWLTNPDSKVSAHFLIDLEGKIYQLVEEKDIAWHAGLSELHGRQYVNNFSVGIEVVGDTNLKEFTPEQMKSLIELTTYLLHKYNIKAENIVSHREIAPGRKTDLNQLHFDWISFYRSIGVMD